MSAQLVADCAAATKTARGLSVEEHLKILGRLAWTRVAPGKPRAVVVGFVREALPMLSSRLDEMPPRDLARLLQPLGVPYVAEGARVPIVELLGAALPAAMKRATEFDVVDAATFLRALARLPLDEPNSESAVAFLKAIAPALIRSMPKATAAQCAGLLQPLHLLRRDEEGREVRQKLASAALERAIATASDCDPGTAAEASRALAGKLPRDAELVRLGRAFAAAVLPHVVEQAAELSAGDLADILTFLGEKEGGADTDPAMVSKLVTASAAHWKPETMRGSHLAAIVGSARHIAFDDAARASLAALLSRALPATYRKMEPFEAARVLGSVGRLPLDAMTEADCLKLATSIQAKLCVAASRLHPELMTAALDGLGALPEDKAGEIHKAFLAASLPAATANALRFSPESREIWKAAIKRHKMSRQAAAKALLARFKEAG